MQAQAVCSSPQAPCRIHRPGASTHAQFRSLETMPGVKQGGSMAHRQALACMRPLLPSRGIPWLQQLGMAPWPLVLVPWAWCSWGG